ncbi:calpastatin [Rhynchocyon petersi]
MNPAETKDAKTEPEKKFQSTKPSVVHEKKLQEEKPKEHRELKNLPKHGPDTGDKHAHSEKPTEPKSDIDAALDDLVDTLGKPEDKKEETTYMGPEVSDPVSSTYIEELGKKESTIPPKYRHLLDNLLGEEAIDALSASLGTRKPEPELDLSSLKEVQEGKAREEKLKMSGEDEETIPPEFRLKPDKLLSESELIDVLSEDFDQSKSKSESELIDALSEDFGQSKSKEKPSKPTENVKGSKPPAPSPVEEALSQTSMCSIQSPPPKSAPTTSAPPKSAPTTSATSKSAVPDDAVEFLAGSLGERKTDPEDGKPVVDKVKEKSKGEKREKLGEKEETIPPDYRLEETKGEDGKPLLPKESKEVLPPMTDDLLLDALSEDFSGPRDTSCSKSAVPDDAVEFLAGSLGERKTDPEDGKPVVDKVKEKAKGEKREKLGEKEETIPPDYRLEETKGKDGKPLLPKEPKEALPPMTDDLLLDALSKDFSGPKDTSFLKLEDAKLSAIISDVVSETAASTTHSAHPPPKAPQSDNKGLDDALDQLSDSLGQREPDPEDNKPLEDKVKERAKAEHRDKLGERDDTIPPEYRHLLDKDDQGKSGKPPTKKPKESTKPVDDQDPIDALSEDFNNCSSTTETSQKAPKKASV